MEGQSSYGCQEGREFLLSGATTAELIRAAFAKDALFRFKVIGFSMSPFLRDQDVITLSPLGRSHAGLGKVVACISPSFKRLLVHRIIAQKGDAFLIKGDNCRAPDGPVDKKDILGYVVRIERKDKAVFFGLGPERVIIALLSRVGFLSLAAVIWRFIRAFLKKIIPSSIPL